MTLTCTCGAVRIDLARRPDFIHACNCTACGRTGAHWGYFQPAEVSVHGATTSFSRDDRAEANAAFHACAACGASTHFALTDSAIAKFGNAVMGVNMRLADRADLAGIELRYPDGLNWPGEGPFDYVRAAEVIGG